MRTMSRILTLQGHSSEPAWDVARCEGPFFNFQCHKRAKHWAEGKRGREEGRKRRKEGEYLLLKLTHLSAFPGYYYIAKFHQQRAVVDHSSIYLLLLLSEMNLKWTEL